MTFTRRVLVNRALKVTANTVQTSHRNEVQAMLHPLGLAMPSSKLNEMMEEAKTKTPTQMRSRKKGCEARTARDS